MIGKGKRPRLGRKLCYFEVLVFFEMVLNYFIRTNASKHTNIAERVFK